MTLLEREGWVLETARPGYADRDAQPWRAWVSDTSRHVVGFGRGAGEGDAVRAALSDAGHHYLSDADVLSGFEREYFGDGGELIPDDGFADGGEPYTPEELGWEELPECPALPEGMECTSKLHRHAKSGELFEQASRQERRAGARARRAEARERRLAIRTEGQQTSEVEGQAWIEASRDYFGVRPEQPKLF
jgi:hypothetical protein